MNRSEVSAFIKTHITNREDTLFSADLAGCKKEISKEIFNKSVLVIGGAGTIGTAFIKALLDFRPARLFVVDQNENGLTELTRDLRSTSEQYLPDEFITYPMDFASESFQRLFFQEGKFDIVANFAAHKHVRSEKDIYAIEAMLENNVFKTKKLLDMLCKAPPSHFFCVSTDKATSPANLMGASKQLMEMLLMSYCDRLKITTARFANVAFSNGSLLDGYLQRLYKLQALSCPENIRRYFISPEESGQICLIACLMGKSGDIFFPRLSSEDLKSFKEITISFLKAHGLDIQVCKTEQEAKAHFIALGEAYPVYFFPSATTGEKLEEEFYSPEDQVNFDEFSSLGIIKSQLKIRIRDIDGLLSDLQSILVSESVRKSDIINLLGSFLQDFQHHETGKSLDQQM